MTVTLEAGFDDLLGIPMNASRGRAQAMPPTSTYTCGWAQSSARRSSIIGQPACVT
jgi:hypothetical protein